MKTNEAVLFRSPKWLRDYRSKWDWEIATGKDLKAKKEAKRKQKEYEEKMRREAEERQRRREEEEREEEERKKEFGPLFNGIKEFLHLNYRDIVEEVDVVGSGNVIVKFHCSHPSYGNINGTITYLYEYSNPTYDVIFETDKRGYFEFRVSGILHYDLANTLAIILRWWRESGKSFGKKKSKSYDKDYGYYGKKEEPKTARRAERPHQQTERDPRANRLRRLALLRQTLEGYEATLAKTKKGTRDYETLQNEIETIKGRIRAMERAANEGFNHVMSFQLFEKQFSPNRGDYVMITYALTGEPVPVKIEKVYPNNTYLVSFNVDGSTAKGAPNQTIKNSDIISPYKPIRSPVGTGYISANTNMSIRQVHQVSNDMYL